MRTKAQKTSLTALISNMLVCGFTFVANSLNTIINYLYETEYLQYLPKNSINL